MTRRSGARAPAGGSTVRMVRTVGTRTISRRTAAPRIQRSSALFRAPASGGAWGVVGEGWLAPGRENNSIGRPPAGLFQGGTAGRQGLHFEGERVPPAGLRAASVGHRARGRTLRPAEPKGEGVP